MDKKVLVAYATKYGGTAEIAERIGEVLPESGLTTDVMPAGRAADLAPYAAVVLGSGVYIGRWLKEAARFLKGNEQTLAAKPVWLFSSGPTGEGDPVELAGGWTFPGALQPTADRIQARNVALFQGVLDERELGRLDRWMIKNVKAPAGDFRDWDAIAAWARSIADALSFAEDASD
ncbi:MAG: flavodoxin domain-containing protein [Anaerolineae bacterium]